MASVKTVTAHDQYRRNPGLFNLSKMATLLAAFGLTTMLTSCLSVNIGPKGPDRSAHVVLKMPPKPYEQLNDEHADGAWQNRKNGNSISYLSICNDASDPSLESVSRELLSELVDVRMIHLGSTTFNARDAIDQEYEGKVDGILTHIRAVIFKKNGCTYTLSYIGVPHSFDADRTLFDNFLKGFQAP